MSITRNSEVIRIRYGETCRVLLEDHQGDRTVIDSGDVVKLCQLVGIGQQTQRKAFDVLAAKIDHWFEQNHEFVDELIFEPNGDRILFLVLMKGTQYNPALEDRLTELDIDIAQDEQTQFYKVDVIAVPNFGSDTLSAFLSQ